MVAAASGCLVGSVHLATHLPSTERRCAPGSCSTSATIREDPRLSAVSLGLPARRPQWLLRLVRLSGQAPTPMSRHRPQASDTHWRGWVVLQQPPSDQRAGLDSRSRHTASRLRWDARRQSPLHCLAAPSRPDIWILLPRRESDSLDIKCGSLPASRERLHDLVSCFRIAPPPVHPGCR